MMINAISVDRLMVGKVFLDQYSQSIHCRIYPHGLQDKYINIIMYSSPVHIFAYGWSQYGIIRIDAVDYQQRTEGV